MVSNLIAAHRGYEYQDLVIATRLVDLLVGELVIAHVDKKLFDDDRFDDLTTVDRLNHRERTQFKHKDHDEQPLTLATFTTDARSLRLDRLIDSAIADRAGPGASATTCLFRVVLRDARPVDQRLSELLRPAERDPGPFLPGMPTLRMQFDARRLLRQSAAITAGTDTEQNPFAMLLGASTFDGGDVEWALERLIIEVEAPSASGDFVAPGPIERMLLNRVRAEVGAELYPNADRSAVDVAEAVVRTARAARQGRVSVTTDELLRRTQLRHDFGMVARAHPVDRAVEVLRSRTTLQLSDAATAAAASGHPLLVVGPPGQGKSWACQQLIDRLSADGWLVAEHYCYLGDADGERLERVFAESVFGSLLGRLAEIRPDLVTPQRPRYAADEEALSEAVARAVANSPNTPVALVVDGIDHVTRIRGGGPRFDPSFALAEALSSLELPPGSVLIVLSQPGPHLDPLETAGAQIVSIPALGTEELRELAARLGVLDSGTAAPPSDSPGGALEDRGAIDEFLAALAERSAGNPLYATYLCREALRLPATFADPAAAISTLPHFDGSLENYYNHLYGSLAQQSGWVADLIALIDFPVSRAELREIRPDAAHRVDSALAVLAPVLVERATQGGVRIYHESFARFLRKPFQQDETALAGLLDHVATWLRGRGLFRDSRAFGSLLRILGEAGRDEEVLELVDREFVGRAIGAAFPVSAINRCLETAIASAARLERWPAVARFVELARAAETFEYERFDSTMVEFADVAMEILGRETLADRLLHDGKPVIAARAGLQMCAAVDALGGVAPWREYMTAFRDEAKHDNTSYGEASDRQVDLAWLRGRLRLSAIADGVTDFDQLLYDPPPAGHDEFGDDAEEPVENDEVDVAAPLIWAGFVEWLDENEPATGEAVDAVLDTYGPGGILTLIALSELPGLLCLTLAERISVKRAPDAHGSARRWAWAAVAHGLPEGTLHRAVALGLNVIDATDQPAPVARDRLLEATRKVQESAIQWEARRLAAWLDMCVVAADSDPLALAAAEALIVGPGWYRCWLRFTISLIRAERALPTQRADAGVEALRLLTADLDPFTGDPRSCDLYSIHGVIDSTVRRAVQLLDDDAWYEAFDILERVSGAVTTTLWGELGGPLPPDRLLRLAVATSTPTRLRRIEAMVRAEIEDGSAGRYYADLADYRLLGARVALVAGDHESVAALWAEACQMLTAYGWHKDITIYELLDPLPSLIEADPTRGRARVADVQPLCERVPLHTDGRETNAAPERWWKLLATADPVALATIVGPAMLKDCNNPNYLLHRARHDAWHAWVGNADALVAGALRLTLEAPLDPADVEQLTRLTESAQEPRSETANRLATLLPSRLDERPFQYSYSNSDALLSQDMEHVASFNRAAVGAGAAHVASHPSLPAEARGASSRPWGGSPVRREISLTPPLVPSFPPGAVGLARAIRAWRSRSYDDPSGIWHPDRVANLLGYRLIELAESDREDDAAAALRMIADAAGSDDRGGVLAAIAHGLDRHDQMRLAAIAYTLAWTRARGHGGWLTFGGRTQLECLRRAAELDRALTMSIVAEEIRSIILRKRWGTYGITEALVEAFAAADLAPAPGQSTGTAFAIWDEAFNVISHRAPRVHPSDDPDDPYVAPEDDAGERAPGDLNVGFAMLALAGLAHPWRENKRRSLLAAGMMLVERPASAAPAFDVALTKLSDPATLSWLLQLMADAGDGAADVTQACGAALEELTQRPHLTVRALARRLLGERGAPIPAPEPPEPELLPPAAPTALWTPTDGSPHEDARGVAELVEDVAGYRLRRGERVLPGLRDAVVRRVAATIDDESHSKRMRRQMDAYADRLEKRWPNAFLAAEEIVEETLQRVATGGRAARLTAGMPVDDPVKWEDQLAEAIRDDPRLPMLIEASRHPRPRSDAPPVPKDPIWTVLTSEGAADAYEGVSGATRRGNWLAATVCINPTDSAGVIESGPYAGWRIVGAIERLVCKPERGDEKDDQIVMKYSVAEIRTPGDGLALTTPPVAEGDLRAWLVPIPRGLEDFELDESQPLLATDSDLRAANDARQGLGIHAPLLTPTLPLLASLALRPSRQAFVLDDDAGPAVALITWRTLYETGEHHLPWPRLLGSGVLMRPDVLLRLATAASASVIVRDFVVGDVIREDEASASGEGVSS